MNRCLVFGMIISGVMLVMLFYFASVKEGYEWFEEQKQSDREWFEEQKQSDQERFEEQKKANQEWFEQQKMENQRIFQENVSMMRGY